MKMHIQTRNKCTCDSQSCPHEGRGMAWFYGSSRRKRTTGDYVSAITFAVLMAVAVPFSIQALQNNSETQLLGSQMDKTAMTEMDRLDADL